MDKIFILNEDSVEFIKEKMKMTEYKFYSNIKYFLAGLIDDPVNTKPTELLKANGLTYGKLINLLIKRGILKRKYRISDKNADGSPKKATMIVSYSVMKKNFNRNLKKLYISLFEKNLPKKQNDAVIEEDGCGGASACGSVGTDGGNTILTPIAPVQRRSMPKIVEGKLNESQESKSQHEARNLCLQNGKDESYIDEIRKKFVILRNKKLGKFILGAVRLGIDGELDYINNDDISDFNNVIKIIGDDFYDEYDKNLNGLHFNELINKFSNELEELNGNNFNITNEPGKYKVVQIKSFDEALEYNNFDYSDYKEARWCLTYRKDMWDYYTKKGNSNVYFLLRNGYENYEPTKGENCPKDEFGLSMISVIIGKCGNLEYSTCRWNHMNGGHDKLFTMKEISDLVGFNFYEYAYNDTKIGQEIELYKNTGKFSEEFEKNYIEGRNFINDVVIIRDNHEDTFNYLTKDGKLLWKKDTWLYDAQPFYGDVALVRINDYYDSDFINKDGKLLFKGEIKPATRFNDGTYIISRNKDNKMNYLDKDGNILGKDFWFDTVFNFNGNYGCVEYDGKCNYINKNGELLIDYDNIPYDISSAWQINDNFFVIKDKSLGLNVMDKNGEILYKNDKWFDGYDIADDNSFYWKGYDNKYCFFKDRKVYVLGDDGNFYDESNNMITESVEPNKQYNKICDYMIKKYNVDNNEAERTFKSILHDIPNIKIENYKYYKPIVDYIFTNQINPYNEEKAKDNIYFLNSFLGILNTNEYRNIVSETFDNLKLDELINKYKDIYDNMMESTTTFNSGDYTYDAPAFGDKETLERNNGVGGSNSINFAK